MQPETAWKVNDRFLELHSRWMTLIGEHLQDQRGQILEYWRIEKADSVIVLSIQAEHLVLLAPSYRPGVGQTTLDFPGGRIATEQNVEQAAIVTLHRELGIESAAITQLSQLNREGWAVNSSFSNQRLYGMVAHITASAQLSSDAVTYSISKNGVNQLLQALTCLQCRAVLLEWWFNAQVQNAASE